MPDFEDPEKPQRLSGLSPSGAASCSPSFDAPDRRYSALVRVSRMSNEEIQRAIDATHPETLDTSRSLAADQLAMMLIHNRHEKREIVNLLRWLILDAPSPENASAMAAADNSTPPKETTL